MFDDIKQIIEQFNDSIKQQLPLLESEVNTLISSKTTNGNAIECYLDTLVSLTIHGLANDLFIRLLEYYKTIDPEGAQFYWNEYDKFTEEK
ncbi:MAG: hypothetical protein R3D00_25175 [Bacteroidia bacterium]